jgi:hypothetical protein
VPVTHTAPALKSDDDVLHFLVVSYFGGAQSGGGETPMSIQVFFNISPEPKNN